MEDYIKIEREFVEVSESVNQDELDFHTFLGFGRSDTVSWDYILNEYRTVILAEAGAGKTIELIKQAKNLLEQGKKSFFIRIEEIEYDFTRSFEVGCKETFKEWLQSNTEEEAWFFLDSVDEARLKTATAFSKAIRRFASEIGQAKNRAHIVVSSRPYSWYPKSDQALMNDSLSIVAEQNIDDHELPSKNKLKVYKLLPLDEERVRLFCKGRGINDIDPLIGQIYKINLWSLAERPFDLDAIINKWSEHKSLGSRLDLLTHNINKRLKDSHEIEKEQSDHLHFDLASLGAKRLAATVVLTGLSNIKVPDSNSNDVEGIDASVVLAGWTNKQVHTLLNRGIFNDILFNSVRFRHREIRELLAANWFIDLLARGTDRFALESMFFKEFYGEQIVTPNLRPLLPWIILDDSRIKEKVIRYYPEIAVEGGDSINLNINDKKVVLRKIVEGLSKRDNKFTNSTESIARISSIDLTEETIDLINKYKDDDEVIFYLGRLVWMGEMPDCVSPLIEIAKNENRRLIARIGSIRGVMTCGTDTQKKSLWKNISDNSLRIEPEILSEFVMWTTSHIDYIDLILQSLLKLPIEKKYSSGLTYELNQLFSRIDVACIIRFIEGAELLINESPFLTEVECNISEKYTWLMSPIAYAIEQIIKTRNQFAFNRRVLDLLEKISKFKSFQDGNFTSDKHNLEVLVPQWTALNDELFWDMVKKTSLEKDLIVERGQPDDRDLLGVDYLWTIDETSIPRYLEQIESKDEIKLKCVALSVAFRFYNNNKDEAGIQSLLPVASKNQVLLSYLQGLKHPNLNEDELDVLQRLRAREVSRQDERIETKSRKLKSDEDLKANPESIIKSLGSNKNAASEIVHYLYSKIPRTDIFSTKTDGANWRTLINEYGTEVAEAYRDATKLIWRHYKPELRSENSSMGNSLPFQVMHGLAGIAIETEENEHWIKKLSSIDTKHLLRYLVWGAGPFPAWFEQVHLHHPTEVLAFVTKEFTWELNNQLTTNGLPYVVSGIANTARFMHQELAPKIYDWAIDNPAKLNIHRKPCIRILINASYEESLIIALAQRQIDISLNIYDKAEWHALIIDLKPESGIGPFKTWIASLSTEEADKAAQRFLHALLIGDHFSEAGPYRGRYKTPDYLKSLILLLNKAIPLKKYKKNLKAGEYLTGDISESEDLLVQLIRNLNEMAGKEAYVALKTLAQEFPDIDAQAGIEAKAYSRAEKDSVQSWSQEQVLQFEQSFNIVPKSHRQLFDLTHRRLIELKNELERGNDSLWKTWQLATNENLLSGMVANWLNTHCGEQYVTAREPELANKQRMDIWVQNTKVRSPVPIELKMLDKGWNGPALCERLQNQLIGDYLRQDGASCGVFLLISQKLSDTKTWEINGKAVTLKELGVAIKGYWLSIQHSYPKIDEIEVVVIDLTERGKFSKT